MSCQQGHATISWMNSLKISGDDAGLALGRDIEHALRGWQQHERAACGVTADLLKLFDARTIRHLGRAVQS